MTPRKARVGVGIGPLRGLSTCAYLLAIFFLFSITGADADAQRRKRRSPKKKKEAVTVVKESKAKEGGKNQVFDFTGLALGASMRTPQLLYFLERASEELDRASLQRRSFVPEMVRSISEEGL